MSFFLFLSLFLLGLTGSFGHCIGMCHPFVLMVSTRYPLSGYKLLIPHLKYNAGRITTYAFLGVLVGALGHLGMFSGNMFLFQKVLTVLAGSILILFAVCALWGIHLRLPPLRIFNNLAALGSPYLMGIILGFLPCGLVLGALIMSAVGTDPLTGALCMVFFGMGTSAGLLVVALFGGLVFKYAPIARFIFPLIMVITGAVFIYRGIHLN